MVKGKIGGGGAGWLPVELVDDLLHVAAEERLEKGKPSRVAPDAF